LIQHTIQEGKRKEERSGGRKGARGKGTPLASEGGFVCKEKRKNIIHAEGLEATINDRENGGQIDLWRSH